MEQIEYTDHRLCYKIFSKCKRNTKRVHCEIYSTEISFKSLINSRRIRCVDMWHECGKREIHRQKESARKI